VTPFNAAVMSGGRFIFDNLNFVDTVMSPQAIFKPASHAFRLNPTSLSLSKFKWVHSILQSVSVLVLQPPVYFTHRQFTIGVLLIGISCVYYTDYHDRDRLTRFFNIVNTYLYGLVTYQFLVYKNTSMSPCRMDFIYNISSLIS
jgi:hypothetical protein